MGGGEFVGNLSVHWSVDHKDDQRVRVKQNEGRRPRGGDAHNVSTDTKVLGRDPKSIEYFNVTLRFESVDDARKQLQEAVDSLREVKTTSFFLNFKVPATINGTPRQDPDAQPGPDVGVTW